MTESSPASSSTGTPFRLPPSGSPAGQELAEQLVEHYSPEIRRVIYSTNAVESLNARMRRATRARGHFPNEQAALKCLDLVVRSLDPTGQGRQRWMNLWKPALNAFAIAFEGRIFPTS